ncbi:MAG TPA: hypothetical protein VGH87_16955 [Polyangiaceae bacterium]|jgi:hypothetical protein|nr:hypothetical protein [Polyangiaceae bacterium]
MKARVFVVAVLVACGRGDRPFTTLATYDAPKSGFRLVVDATGVVPPGEDLTPLGVPTVAVFCPKSVGHALRVDVAGPHATLTDGAKSSAMPWTAAELTRVLGAAGYAAIDHAEIEEALASINGVSWGPKGTRMPGQTHALGVVKIDFTAHAPINVKMCP